MRAAEAIVSSAPKPMKILPISEVWSQALSLLLAAAAARALRRSRGRLGEAMAIGAAGALPSCSARSTSLSWSAADDLGSSRGLRVSRIVRCACTISLARTDMACGVAGRRVGGRQLRVGVGDRWRHLGRWERRRLVGVVGRDVGAAAFLSLSTWISAPPCRICGARTVSSGASVLGNCWAQRCPAVELAAVASRALAAACEGPAKHIQSPAARINAERPLALMVIWQSPHLPAARSEMRPSRHVRSGAKKGNLRAKSGRKQGKRMRAVR